MIRINIDKYIISRVPSALEEVREKKKLVVFVSAYLVRTPSCDCLLVNRETILYEKSGFDSSQIFKCEEIKVGMYRKG